MGKEGKEGGRGGRRDLEVRTTPLHTHTLPPLCLSPPPAPLPSCWVLEPSKPSNGVSIQEAGKARIFKTIFADPEQGSDAFVKNEFTRCWDDVFSHQVHSQELRL